MKVSEVMTRDVHTMRPDQTVREAAGFMLAPTPARSRSPKAKG